MSEARTTPEERHANPPVHRKGCGCSRSLCVTNALNEHAERSHDRFRSSFARALDEYAVASRLYRLYDVPADLAGDFDFIVH